MQQEFNFEAQTQSPATKEITKSGDYKEIEMQKACLSCCAFVHIGWEEDDQHPLLESGIFRKSALTTQVGVCKNQGVKLFGTEICPKYSASPDVIPIEIKNRSVPYGANQ
ncbi:hypothetical protein NQT63_02245 [Pseudoalteromonas agarivorans]|uniref:hypothetical protein n=1 Tax=Pseudoalteromonas agarivorans TaxID=176102 RepID=UPI002118F88D|nr:hypothetical protein [Pseudoalteromonas agarivorans]MCQ8884514.1 hypothetical protein [Pseudoalteromonas agarivorans]